METYSLLREIADSWVLLVMFGFFLAAIFWAFRPGSTAVYADVSTIPLRDDAPLQADSCDRNCATCSCSSTPEALKGFSHD